MQLVLMEATVVLLTGQQIALKVSFVEKQLFTRRR